MTLKRFWIISAFVGALWAAAIIYTATGSLSTHRKDSALAAYVVGALVAAVNLAYRYRQLSKREK